jgi:adenosylcobinamide-phosphate synthase
VMNYLPARATGLLVAVCARVVGGSARTSLAAWRRDAAGHPSPNAGVVEAAFAGALDVGLGGPTQYAHGLEIRPALGGGPPPGVDDLRRSVALSRAVTALAMVLAVAVSAVGRTGRRVSPRQSAAPSMRPPHPLRSSPAVVAAPRRRRSNRGRSAR